jgi:high-affinity K+ transport system ATPase subunit B
MLKTALYYFISNNNCVKSSGSEYFKEQLQKMGIKTHLIVGDIESSSHLTAKGKASIQQG